VKTYDALVAKIDSSCTSETSTLETFIFCRLKQFNSVTTRGATDTVAVDLHF